MEHEKSLYERNDWVSRILIWACYVIVLGLAVGVAQL